MVATKPTSQPTQVRAIIWSYIEEAESMTIDVRDAVKFVREHAPDYDGPEEELTTLVGTLATAAGRAAHFDGPSD
jgi:hypothetical protein